MASLCEKCKLKVLYEEEGVKCDGSCKCWFHRSCCTMPKSEFSKYCSYNREWYCNRPKCDKLSLDRSNQQFTIPLSNPVSSALDKLDQLLVKIHGIGDLSSDIMKVRTEVLSMSGETSSLEQRLKGTGEEQLKKIEILTQKLCDGISQFKNENEKSTVIGALCSERIAVGRLMIDGMSYNIYKGMNLVGREEPADIVIKNNAISLRHAVIEVEDSETHLLCDCGSRNGTRLSKISLKPNITYHLRGDDEIFFANLKAKYIKFEETNYSPNDDENILETNTEPILTCAPVDQGHDLNVIEKNQPKETPVASEAIPSDFEDERRRMHNTAEDLSDLSLIPYSGEGFFIKQEVDPIIQLVPYVPEQSFSILGGKSIKKELVEDESTFVSGINIEDLSRNIQIKEEIIVEDESTFVTGISIEDLSSNIQIKEEIIVDVEEEFSSEEALLNYSIYRDAEISAANNTDEISAVGNMPETLEVENGNGSSILVTKQNNTSEDHLLIQANQMKQCAVRLIDVNKCLKVNTTKNLLAGKLSEEPPTKKVKLNVKKTCRKPTGHNNKLKNHLQKISMKGENRAFDEIESLPDLLEKKKLEFMAALNLHRISSTSSTCRIISEGKFNLPSRIDKERKSRRKRNISSVRKNESSGVPHLFAVGEESLRLKKPKRSRMGTTKRRRTIKTANLKNKRRPDQKEAERSSERIPTETLSLQSWQMAVTNEPNWVLFSSGVSNPTLISQVKKLGGVVVDSPLSCSVYVTDRVRRTVNFLCVLGQGIPIVSPKWIVQSWKCSTFKDPREYLLIDHKAEKRFNFNLSNTFHKARTQPLLRGFYIHATPHVEPSPNEIKSIVECCGGQYLEEVPSTWPENSVVISHVNDKSLWKKLEVEGLTPPIVKAEMLLIGVLKHNLDIQSNILS